MSISPGTTVDSARQPSVLAMAAAGFVAFALPVLAMPGPRGTVVWASVVTLAFLITWAQRSIRPGWPHCWVLLALLVGWGCLSYFWSVEPERTLQRAPRIAATALLGLAMLSLAQALALPLARQVRRGLIAGLALTGIALALERLAGAPFALLLGDEEWMHSLTHRLTIYNRSTSILLPLAFLLLGTWPRLRVPWRFAVMAGALSLFVTTPYLEGGTQTAALLIGLTVALLAFLLPRLVPTLMSVALVATVIVAPAVTPPAAEAMRSAGVARESSSSALSSLAHRLDIWTFVAERTWDRPLIGWGTEAARSIPGAKVTTVEGDAASKRVPHHPHNGILQIWVELGAVGAVLAAMLGGAIVWHCGSGALGDGDRRWLSAGHCGAATTALAIACSSYGIWQEWWFAGLLILSAVAVLLARTPPDRPVA